METAFASTVQSQALNHNMSVNWGFWSSLTEASLIVQLVLVFLILLSVLCWAVTIAKYQQIRQMTEGNEDFLKRFWAAESIDELSRDSEDLVRRSGLARVFQAGFSELQKLADRKFSDQGATSSLHATTADNLERSLRKAVSLELASMESRLTLLATTGSTGPFIGLFGTVWGIMNSFHKIGATGSASLAVVAPGISEALFTTAVGLIAAIPAVVMYNQFVARIRHEETELNNFVTDFLNIAKRNFFS